MTPASAPSWARETLNGTNQLPAWLGGGTQVDPRNDQSWGGPGTELAEQRKLVLSPLTGGKLTPGSGVWVKGQPQAALLD